MTLSILIFFVSIHSHNFQNFLITPHRNLYLLMNNYTFAFSPASGNHYSTFFLNLTVLDISYKLSHTKIIVWLTLFSKIPSKLTHVIACVRIPYFLCLKNIHIYSYTLQFMHSLVSWWTFILFRALDYCK